MLISEIQRVVTHSALQRTEYTLQSISMLQDLEDEVIAPRSTAVRYISRYEYIDFRPGDDDSNPGSILIPHEQYLRIGENGQFNLIDQYIPERRYIDLGDNCFFSMYSNVRNARNVVITGKDDCSVIIKDQLCDDFRLEGDSYVCKILRGSVTIVVLKGTLTMTINGESLVFPEHIIFRFFCTLITAGNFNLFKSRIDTAYAEQRRASNMFHYDH